MHTADRDVILAIDDDEAVRASCIEFILAGLYANSKISRSQDHGRITYET